MDETLRTCRKVRHRKGRPIRLREYGWGTTHEVELLFEELDGSPFLR